MREQGGGPAAAVYWFDGDPRWRPPQQVTPLTAQVEADVCIVGGGFTGLWSALHIKRLAPRTEVVLLEREFCGAGAAGRNGGW
ncbi:MAG: FAD-dependent oxidoreductase, partial [Actinobacteria bacterium]|nr:FAD-dependent oxidoreductase [Actinomycetota bacterium]